MISSDRPANAVPKLSDLVLLQLLQFTWGGWVGGWGGGLELLRKGGGWVEGALELQRKGALELQQALY